MGLIRILMFAVIAGALYALVRKLLPPPGARGERTDPEAADERLGRLVQDPQCGVYVDSDEAVRMKVPGGSLFFCSSECAEAHQAKSRGEG